MTAEFEWATPEDQRLAERDAVLYGNCFVKRGEDGLMRRIDPTTVIVSGLDQGALAPENGGGSACQKDLRANHENP